MEQAKLVIEEVARSFGETFGRYTGGLIETYRMEDATDVFVGMGSVVVDDLPDGARVMGVPARPIAPTGEGRREADGGPV